MKADSMGQYESEYFSIRILFEIRKKHLFFEQIKGVIAGVLFHDWVIDFSPNFSSVVDQISANLSMVYLGSKLFIFNICNIII